MQFKKRILSAAALIGLAAAVFYGGHFEMTDPADQVEKESLFSGKETIYFWYADENLAGYINSAAVAFGEAQNVRVIPVQSNAGEYLEAINKASLTTEQIPDAFILGHESLEKAYLAGLASEIADEGSICNEATFPTAAVKAVTYHDKKVAYPLYYQTSALVYNETYLKEWARQEAEKELLENDRETEGEEEPAEGEVQLSEADEQALEALTLEKLSCAVPATIDDILQIADTFDAPEGVEGVMEWDVSDISYNYWIVGNYLQIGGENGDDPAVMDINNQQVISCLEVFQALNQFFSMDGDTSSYEAMVQDFMDGKSVFTIATSDICARLAAAKEDGSLTFDYGIAMMPDISSDLASRSMSVTGTVAVNGYSEHKELANRFAAFLVKDYAGELYDRSGKPAACRQADTDNSALEMFKKEYEESIPLPKMMETENFWLHLESLFEEVWKQENVEKMVEKLDAAMKR